MKIVEYVPKGGWIAYRKRREIISKVKKHNNGSCRFCRVCGSGDSCRNYLTKE